MKHQPSGTAREAPAPLERHFTVTGFLSHGDRTALHWHWLGMWLPPGGHIEPNEDPVQAVIREVKEETGVDCDIVRAATPYDYDHPPQLPPPVTIGVYDIDEPGNPHQHIDLVYFTRPRAAGDEPPPLPAGSERWTWVSEETLRTATPSMPGPDGEETPIAEDVRRLALDAIARARAAAGVA